MKMELRYVLFDEGERIEIMQMGSLREALEKKKEIKRNNPDHVVRIEIIQ